MGKIYINPKTGELWESSARRRKPPEGYEYTGHFINYNWHRKYHAKTYYCPICSKYHAVIKLYDWPLYAEMMVEWGSKHGCKEMEEMMKLTNHLGPREAHYRMVERLKEIGMIHRVLDLFERYKLDAEDRRAVARMFLNGRSEEDVLAFLIAKELSHR